MTASTSSALPLGKYLASTEKKTRDKAIKILSTFLSDPSQDAIPRSEMIKLWKGIFYCFWMSDKPLVQQALASELAEIVLTITTTTSALTFLSGFWETIVREWNGIDRLRMDKYYMLVRRFVNASFRLLIREDWDARYVEEYNKILSREGGPLNPTDTRVPSSLPFHLSDIYLEELDKAMKTSSKDSDISPTPLKPLLIPFFRLAARTNASTTSKHLQSTLIQPLLSSFSSSSEEPGDLRSKKRRRLNSGSDGEEPLYPSINANSCFDEPTSSSLSCPVLKQKILKEIFKIAGEPESRDSNRRRLYALWKEEKDDDDDDV
ncbi:Nop52-domain-containing protein [Dendrothele bispora CBS 962.96]|uniref:Nop52-domain-containing protein n=1 Tax=Dendrothele bispora (strain CBS 962.96) TaxID=1314807 RepID=A0A4S8MW33_DENBC|nr:Nop52-domain-containing protein [Dendrothele bispora CBS 962.96]